MNRLTLLPDDIYKHVYSYVFQPSKSINKWSNKHNTICYLCKETKDTNMLFHICTLCPPYIAYTNETDAVCNNTFICIYCMSA